MELSPRTAPLDEPETHGAEQSVGAGQHDEQSEPEGERRREATTLIKAAAVAAMQASETPGVMKRSVGRFMTTPAASMRLAPPRAPRLRVMAAGMTTSMTFGC